MPTNAGDDVGTTIRALISESEALLGALGQEGAQRYRDAVAGLQRQLQRASDQMSDLQDEAARRARVAAQQADAYVRENPWKTAGAAAIIGAAIGAAVALATRLKVKPEDNPTSEGLKNGGDDNLAKLKGLKDSAFDDAYIAHEIAYHEQVLDAVDKVLIPSAKNDELKALIAKVRPAFVAHLEHAKMIQARLAKG